MPHIYEHVFERFRIVDSSDSSIEDRFSRAAQWLETPGCLFQRNNFVLDSQVRTEGIIKPGLFLTVVLKGTGAGGPRKGAARFRYADNTIVVMALREPTPCGGDAPRGAHMRAAGVAFPASSLEQLGLRDEFLDLFEPRQSVFITSLKASPRIQAIAVEMLSPVIEGKAGQLLLSAHATEILVRTMFALRARADPAPGMDEKRFRLQVVRDLIKSDLRYPWTIAELARHAGLSRRFVQRAISADLRHHRGRLSEDRPPRSGPRSAGASGLVRQRSCLSCGLRQPCEFLHRVSQAFWTCAEQLPSG